jgi:hypothetical protein
VWQTKHRDFISERDDLCGHKMFLLWRRGKIKLCLEFITNSIDQMQRTPLLARSLFSLDLFSIVQSPRFSLTFPLRINICFFQFSSTVVLVLFAIRKVYFVAPVNRYSLQVEPLLSQSISIFLEDLIGCCQAMIQMRNLFLLVIASADVLPVCKVGAQDVSLIGVVQHQRKLRTRRESSVFESPINSSSLIVTSCLSVLVGTLIQ